MAQKDTKVKDTSLFIGIVEFTAPNGREYRAVAEGGIWGIYKKRKHILGSSFVRVGSVPRKKRDTASKIWARYEDEK